MSKQNNIIEETANVVIPADMSLKPGQMAEIANYAKESQYGEKFSMMEIAFKYGYLQGMRSAGKKS